jgi:alkylation response protein AidB-like acyl-CoA dehydrogenase
VDFDLPEELRELQRTVRRMAQHHVQPVARELDARAEYPEDLFRLFAGTGLMGLVVPEEYGGSGAGILGLVVAVEEVAKYCQSSALMLLLSRLAPGPILVAGTAEQKRRWAGGIADGSLRGSFALSEAGAGSDIMGQRTRATPDGDGYRLSGTKSWISGATVADFFTTFAKHDPAAGHRGFTAFVVPRDTPGVSIGRADDKMGVRAVPTAEVIFDDVYVGPEHLIGAPGDGFKIAVRSLNAMRPIVAARGVGLAAGALMYAVAYDKERRAFGGPVSDLQGVRWMYAELATEIEAARLLTYRAAQMVDAGRYELEDAPYLSMAKYYATELAVKASGHAVQLLGAAGYTKDHITELYYRDARQLTIVEGTTQIQMNLIGQGVVRGDVWWD